MNAASVFPKSTTLPLDSDSTSTISRVDIAHRAYLNWQNRCDADNQERRDWLQAEADLRSEATAADQLVVANDRSDELSSNRRHADRRLTAEHAVSNILAVAHTFAEAAPQIIQAISECFDWDVGVVWRLDPDLDLLHCVDFWHRPQRDVDAFEHETRFRTFERGTGLPGRVWASNRMVWAADLTADTNFSRAAVASLTELHGGVAFPIHNEVEFLGVLEFFSQEMLQPDAEMMEMMISIGSHIGQFITRRGTEGQLLQQEHERRVGQDIQQSLLPKTMPQLPGFEIEGRSFAPHVVGGDCFDFIPLAGAGRDCLGIFLADASGHGIGSALLTVQTCAYLRGVATSVSDIAILLERTNQCLRSDLASFHFVTAVLAMLDPHTRSLTYTSAGHLPGYVLDPQGRIRVVLHSTGFPLGIDQNEKFPAFAVSLEPGDLVLLLTDGITEAASADHILFGMERTLNLVREHQHQTPSEIITAMFAAVSHYSNGKCTDDMTAIIIKITESS